MVNLNPLLLIEQQCSLKDIETLHTLHGQKDDIFKRAAVAIPSAASMQPLVQELREVEYAMQRAWHFTPDSEKHTWKYFIPNTPFDFPEYGTWANEYIMGSVRLTGLGYL